MFVSTSVIVKSYYAIKNGYFTYRCPVGIVTICKLPKRRMDMRLPRGAGASVSRMPGHEEALKLIERFIQHLLMDCE